MNLTSEHITYFTSSLEQHKPIVQEEEEEEEEYDSDRWSTYKEYIILKVSRIAKKKKHKVKKKKIIG